MVNYTAAQLKLALTIRRVIESLEAKIHKQAAKLSKVLGGKMPSSGKTGKGRNLSTAGRARIAAAQKARWAKIKGNGAAKSVKEGKRTMSAIARARIAKAAKARWAKVKAAGKNRL